MIILPGVRSARGARRSGLAFYWHARDCSLRAITGQQGVLANSGVGTTGGSIIPAVGSNLTAGTAQPRFSRVGGVNVLSLAGNVGGQDIEGLTFPFNLRNDVLTMLLRLQGLWTAGASMTGGVASIGVSDAGAGAVRVLKSTTNWQIGISKNGVTTSTTSLAENAALVWPVDALVTYDKGAGIVGLTLRSANGTLYGPVSAGSASFITTAHWGGGLLALGYDGVGPSLGVPMHLHFAKIALGALFTYAQMDALA